MQMSPTSAPAGRGGIRTTQNYPGNEDHEEKDQKDVRLPLHPRHHLGSESQVEQAAVIWVGSDLTRSLVTGWTKCVLQLQASDWMLLEWPDYFSELLALRTSAAHWTGRLDAAGCSCTIYTSIIEGGDRQSKTHPLSVPSLISPLLSHSLSPSNTLWKRRKTLVQVSRPPFFSAQCSVSHPVPVLICQDLLTLCFFSLSFPASFTPIMLICSVRFQFYHSQSISRHQLQTTYIKDLGGFTKHKYIFVCNHP